MPDRARISHYAHPEQYSEQDPPQTQPLVGYKLITPVDGTLFFNWL